jgi:HEAT repeat protein
MSGENETGGTLFLVLDGLDEVRSIRFAFDVLDEVQSLARRGNVVLLTCRIRSLAAYTTKLEGFDVLRLDGLPLDETELFVRRYPGLLNPDRLFSELRQDPSMLQLVREPFLLDAVCYLAAKSEGALPECRSELLDKTIDQLLLDVDVADFPWPDDNPPSHTEFRRVLADASLRLRLQEENGDVYNLFSLAKFEQALRSAIDPPKSNLVGVLARFFSETRLLQLPPQQQISRENYGSFSHGLFLDFLAAEGLGNLIESSKPSQAPWQCKVAWFSNEIPADRFLALKAHDLAWFELFCFLPSRLREPKHFFEILAETPDDLARRGATLAIRALAELRSANLVHPDNQDWVENVAQSCWDIASVHWQLGVTRVVEPLIAAMSSIARVYPRLLERLSRDLISADLQTRLKSLAALDRVGPAAAVIPGVIDGLVFNLRDRNWTVRKITSATVAKMGRFAVADILKLLDKSAPPVALQAAQKHRDIQHTEAWFEQASACEAIGQIGPLTLGDKLGDAVGHLLGLVSHDQPLIRANACEALGNLAPQIPAIDDVVRRLTELAGTAERDVTVKTKASGALGKCGAVAAQSNAALDALTECVVDQEEAVRTSAGKALSELCRFNCVDGRRVFTALLRYADSDIVSARASVCETLGQLRGIFKQHPEDFIRVLTAKIRDQDLTVCKSASQAIANLEIKIADASVIARLLDALTDVDWHRRASAVATIGNVRESVSEFGEHVFDRLRKNLRDSRWFVRASSCAALGLLAPMLASASPEVVQELVAVLNPIDPELVDHDGHVVAKALGALPKFGLTRAGSIGVLERMAEFLTSPHWQVQLAACDAFAEIGSKVVEVGGVVDGLIVCMRSEIWCVRAHGTRALGALMGIGRSGFGLAELLACLCDDQRPVRIEASEVFTRLAGGALGFDFLIDVGRRKLVASRREREVLSAPFPKPTPILFLHSLSVGDITQPRTVRYGA